MIIIKKSAVSALCLLAAGAAAYAENITMNTPESFQVLSLSPNGKWACGVYVDATGVGFGFRWNLESGSIEMLGNGASTAWDVANDGTVSGDFGDTEALASGAPVTLPGYWRDGAWHHLEMPEGTPQDGMGCGITADGRCMVGSVAVNGIYSSYIWEDGHITRKFGGDNHAIAYAIAPDGKAAAGWAMQYNRVATYWAPDGSETNFTDSEYCYGPWNYARNFSPDGTKLLYWGGWAPEENGDNYLYSIYDLTTGERIRVKAPAYESDLEFFDISNSGMLVGLDRGRGYVWTGQEGMYIDDYLALRGVDLSGFEGFYGGNDYYVGQLPIFRVIAVSEDEKVLAMQYYDTIGEVCSMVVKIDQDPSSMPPAEVTVNQLSGLNTVEVKWKRPVGATNIRGYNIYRDGKKVNGFLPVNVPYFYDKNVAPGSYSYEVSAVSVSGSETRAAATALDVKELKHEAPSALFARRKGVNNAYLSWAAPLAPGAHKRYHDIDNTDYSGFAVYEPVAVEMAVAFDKAEMANYTAHRITDVSFVPMAEQDAWAVNVYTRDAAGALSLAASRSIDAASLKYGELNTIRLAEPIAVPNADVVVAIEVKVREGSYQVIGAQPGRVVVGYSDLLRQKSEPDFYSAFERSAASGYSISTLAWVIDVTLQPDGDTAAVNSYNVYLEGEKAGETTSTSFTAECLEDGMHTVGVEAVYSDGTESAVTEIPLDIKANYIPVGDVSVDAGADGSTKVTASWTAPVDRDLTPVSYTSALTHSTGIKGLESNGYALMAANEYPSRMLRGYEGYRIDSFRFYPLADALFTFMLFEGEDQVYEYEVEDFTIGRWNEVFLPDDVFIKANKTYRLVLDCFDPEPDTPVVAMDNAAPREYYSDLYSVDNGLNWSSTTVEASTHGNWMLDMRIAEPQGTPVAVDGYDVVVDGNVANGARISDTTYTHEFGKWDDKEHSLGVNVYYPAKSEAVEGAPTLFHLSVTGIADGMIANITLHRGDNWLVADGDGVDGIEVFATSGAEVASAKGDRVDISALAPGIYMVRIHAGASCVTRKININNK